MNVRYAITVDPSRDLLRIDMGGFFREGDVAAFTQKLAGNMPLLRCPANMHVTIIDISAMRIQAQDIVAMFSRVVGHDRFRSKRLAFVVGSSLARKQAMRLTSRPGVAFFTNVTQAEAYVFGMSGSAAAA